MVVTESIMVENDREAPAATEEKNNEDVTLEARAFGRVFSESEMEESDEAATEEMKNSEDSTLEEDTEEGSLCSESETDENDGETEEEKKKKKNEVTKVKGIRRYYCEFCGIGRSKRTLINSHMLAHHKEEMEKKKADECCEGNEGKKANVCEECGASFRKPAYLKQHMLSHLPEKPFACPVHDCKSSYRRKDHLTRHLLKHEGKLFTCPVENCNRKFAFQGNMKRHINELHDDNELHDEPLSDVNNDKQHVCQESRCGKKFKYESQLRKHEDSHVKLNCIETICCVPGCMKHFTNAECLKAHVQTCHQYINCEVCGTKQLKKNIKRHMRTHEREEGSSERINCSFEGCLHTFATKSNLNQHIKSVHLDVRPFTCRVSGCGKCFPFRHVRDNHEKTHIYIQADFVELDEQFRSKPRGGCKRKYPCIESLSRKRIAPPSHSESMLNQSSEYLSWLLSDATDEN